MDEFFSKLFFYWCISALFMFGFINNKKSGVSETNGSTKAALCFLSPMVVPVMIGHTFCDFNSSTMDVVNHNDTVTITID